MTLATDLHQLDSAAYAPRLVASVERLRCGMLWLTAFSGAFVFMEPSPYEVISLLAMVLFAITGLTLRAAIMPLVLLLIGWNIGFSIAVIPLLDHSKPAIWVLVSWYMAGTGVFFAAALCSNTEQRLELLSRGYTVAALTASTIAILAYFHLIPFSDLFLRFDRARGTFNDPNVLGAFLVFPALLAFQRILSASRAQAVRAGIALAIMLMALLLSFSRAAWGQLAGTGALLMLVMLITTHSSKERVRIVAAALFGIFVVALVLLALLSVDRVAELFKERASLDQPHDTGHFGRFGRHVLGFALALETPLGLGPYGFGRIFPEDPHNTFLNAFMCGGWISGICYPAIVLVTAVRGVRFLFVPTPWQRAYQVVFCAFVGVVGESLLIDIDHWRHYFLLLGAMWGLMAATRAYRLNPVAASGPRIFASRPA